MFIPERDIERVQKATSSIGSPDAAQSRDEALSAADAAVAAGQRRWTTRAGNRSTRPSVGLVLDWRGPAFG